MVKSASRKVAFVSSFPPKRCGIATFTSDLISNIKSAGGKNFEPLVVATQSGPEWTYAEPVKFEIRHNVKNDYISAADYLNFSHVDIVSVQHEFGLFGGEAGSYLNLLLRKVNAPIITTLHTVLEEPDEFYYKSTVDVCQFSRKVIVMNHRGIEMLQRIYGVAKEKIQLIPHGIPDLPFVDSSYYKHKFGMDGRRTILTFGLLSKNKGIEAMLRAMPKIIEADPSVLYIILGATHPNVVAHEGEEYRFNLQRLVAELNLQNHVIFHNQFVSDERLHNFLCAADLYVTPYLNKEQLTSGTLAFAVGTGKAVISTPYWAAEELLADNRGRLVPFNDPESLAKTVVEIIRDNSQFHSLRRKAYDYGRKMAWPVVGKSYWKIFSAKQLPLRIRSKKTLQSEEIISTLELPEPSLEHLQRLTDNTGLWQHARFTIPDREQGYCTDDNTRGLIVMTKYYSQYGDPEALKLFDTYLAFVCHAQNNDGTFHNFMEADRNWRKNEAEHDGLGRALWAFGSVMAASPLPMYLPVIKDCFDKSVKHVPHLSARGMAYAILGMADYLKQFPGASDIKRYMILAAEILIKDYELNSRADWQWFEDKLTYDNAVLVHALYIAAMTTRNEKYFFIAEKTRQFLLDNTFDGDHFSFIGCNGWYRRGKERAQFDQQPLEAAGTVLMLKEAYDTTLDSDLLQLQKKAFDWYLGDNDLRLRLYDFRTKGCCDGLGPTSVNLNQGAESMVSFLLALLCMIESFTPEREALAEIENITDTLKSTSKGLSQIKEIRPDSVLDSATTEKSS